MTYLFNVKDIFTKEWVGYFYSRTCNRFDALMSIENAILRHPERYSEGRVNDTVLRCDNGDQYTSHHFKDNARLLGFTMEFIEKSIPQQNGDVELYCFSQFWTNRENNYLSFWVFLNTTSIIFFCIAD